MALDLAETMKHAEMQAELFQQQMESVPYEEKGMLFSEVFFIRSALGSHHPPQILESGRARAQSTHALGLAFPESRIVSIERYDVSEDAPVAERRLQGLGNVAPLYGDSETVLPGLVRDQDAVVIDGPKRFRAIRLALRMLQTGKPVAVFVHDCYKGLPERDVLEKYLPEAFFSDAPEFVERYRHLDETCWSTIEREGIDSWGPYEFDGAGQESYGPTLACIPFKGGRNYRQLLFRLRWKEVLSKLSREQKKSQ